MIHEGNEFGKGWISGTASVSLAVIGLSAVFCFHFPSYLTIPSVREYYPVSWIRLALHIVLVSAFLLGLTSVMLRQNKTLGMLGMGIVAVAALLGGSRVQLDESLKDDYYLGLDYALLILIVYSLIFIPMEKLFGRLKQSVFRDGWQLDATYFFISTMLVQITTYLTLKPAVVLFAWAQFRRFRRRFAHNRRSSNSLRSCSWPIWFNTGCIGSFIRFHGFGSSMPYIIRQK